MSTPFRALPGLGVAGILALLLAGCGGGDSPELTVLGPTSAPRTASLADVATIEFPPDAIGNEEVVLTKATDDRFRTLFTETAGPIFNVPIQGPYQVIVRVLGRQPTTDAQATLIIPQELRVGAPVGAQLRVFYLLYQGNANEDIVTVEPTDDLFPIDSESVTVMIPAEAFSNEDAGGNTMQAVLYLGVVVPSAEPESVVPPDHIVGKAAAQCSALRLRRPLAGNPHITDTFRIRTVHPVSGEVNKPHRGVDFEAADRTPVLAAADGRVSASGWQLDTKSGRGWGFYVVVTHDDGGQTLYAHLTEGSIRPNGRVKAGEQIALSDSSGGVKGPHLHFELAMSGEVQRGATKKINPLLCDEDAADIPGVAVFAGEYSGMFLGTDFGSFKVTISKEGTISGSGVSNREGAFTVNGSVDASGKVDFRVGGSASTGAGFSGSVNPSTGSLSGTWSNGPDSGTFSGRRQTEPVTRLP